MTASELGKNKSLPVPEMTTVIQATHGWSTLGLKDLWEYRELLMLLIWREIRGVYRQTALGASWLFLRPILNVIVLTLVFGVFVKIPSNNLPYALFSLSALLPWGYFSSAVLRSAGSLVQNMDIISKVYFPRMIIAVAGVLSGLVDLLASFLVFFIIMPFFKLPLRIEMLWLPAFTLAAVVMALMAGLWLATLSVRYRDVAFAVNFLLQALMYLSPVIYPISSVPKSLVFLYQLNPMAGIIDGFRWSLLGPAAGSPPGTTFWISMGIMAVLLVMGAFVFRRTERTIVDVL